MKKDTHHIEYMGYLSSSCHERFPDDGFQIGVGGGVWYKGVLHHLMLHLARICENKEEGRVNSHISTRLIIKAAKEIPKNIKL